MNKHIVYIATAVLVATTFFACKPKAAVTPAPAERVLAEPVTPGLQGVLRNMEGLDGCKWMIELTNGKKIQPTNLADFTIELQDGKPVWVDYVEQDGVMSTCMAGKVVKIVKILAR